MLSQSIYAQSKLCNADSLNKDTVINESTTKKNATDKFNKYTAKCDKIERIKILGEIELTTTNSSRDSWLGYHGAVGYQFNPYVYLGGGTGITLGPLYPDLSEDELKQSVYIPIFGNMRLNLLKNYKYVPFLDFKSGYSIKISNGKKGEGFYYNPSIGVKSVVGLNNFISAVTLSIGSTIYERHNYLNIKIGLEF